MCCNFICAHTRTHTHTHTHIDTPPPSDQISQDEEVELQIRPHPNNPSMADESIRTLVTTKVCTVAHLVKFLSVSAHVDGGETSKSECNSCCRMCVGNADNAKLIILTFLCSKVVVHNRVCVAAATVKITDNHRTGYLFCSTFLAAFLSLSLSHSPFLSLSLLLPSHRTYSKNSQL